MKGLTQSELATYQSMRDRGYNHETALSDALDGVDVETVRENGRAIAWLGSHQI